MTEKQIIDYLKRENVNIQSANASIIGCDLVFYAYINSYDIHGLNFSPLFSYISYKRLGPSLQIVPQKFIDNVAKKIYMDYSKNPKSLINKIEKHKNLEKRLDGIWEIYQKNKNRLSNKELLKTYLILVKILREWWGYAVFLEDKGEIINSEFIPSFAQNHNFTLEEARDVMHILSSPKTLSVFNVERKDFLNICIYVLENKKLKKYQKEKNFSEFLKDTKLKQKIERYIKKYFWFKTDFYRAKKINPELLLKDILFEIENNKKSVILKELKDIDKNFAKIIKRRNQLLSNIKLTREEKRNISFYKFIINWMDQRKVGSMKGLYYFYSFIGNLARKFDLKYDDLAIYTVDEIKDFLRDKKKISKKNIINRNKEVFFLYEKGKKTGIFYEEKAKKIFTTAIYANKEKEIKGEVACRGGIKKVKGKIRIVHRPRKDKFNKGEILVTSMTRVEFIHIMRKAKAVITNEGGMACHAAIVSRELNIPCIVGTKIATKVLKDGDLVEVDTDKGIVRVFKK